MKSDNHLAEYITCLVEDPTLLEGLKNEPVETLNDARLSKEEKEAMWSGDVERVRAMADNSAIPDPVRQAIAGLGEFRSKRAAAS
ncbi:MAG: hypothetical protein BMS9Abin01_0607 [Gammaproteobacteria bacterium]|nr:MAG: hypothetical protein BMS9Abin01_0607 [Gammaproteobacteria bacterium]